MICPLGKDCGAPQCKGRAWEPDSTSSAAIEAFKADVVRCMRRTGLQPGPAAVRVMAEALKTECLFS